MSKLADEIAFLRSLWMCDEEAFLFGQLVCRTTRMLKLKGEEEIYTYEREGCNYCEGTKRESPNTPCSWCSGLGWVHPDENYNDGDGYNVWEHQYP